MDIDISQLEYLSVMLLASLSVISTIVGVGLAYYFRKSVWGVVVGIGFSTGIMLLISFFELIPEAIDIAGWGKSLLALFLGLFFIWLLNIVIPHTHLIEEKSVKNRTLVKTAYLIVFGLILHDFPEGFAMANSYIHSPSLGLLVAIAIALHNIPEEFAMTVPLLLTDKKNLILKVATLSALAEPVGAIIGLLAVGVVPSLNPFFMAFAAGAMIFVSLHELLPMAERYKKKSLFVLGIVLSVIIYLGLNMLIST